MRIPRFDASARTLHWSHAVVFSWLMATGIWISFTSISLLGDPLIRRAHLYASLFFVILPFIICKTGSLQTRKDVKELTSRDRSDTRWLMDTLKGKKATAAGKFNAGQKMNFAATLLLLAGLSFSGFVVWMRSMFSVGFVELNFLAHDILAVLAVLLFAGHIALALYYGESLRGIISGDVDEKWAKEHYPEWSELQFR